MTTIAAAITTYNRASELHRCIDSVIRQSSPVDEILIIDDGSTDDTRQIIENISSNTTQAIKYIHQDNAGAASARNRAFENSNCDYVAFLDDDDIWTDSHIEVSRKLISDYPSAIVISGLHARDTIPNSPIVPENTALFSAYVSEPNDPNILIKKASPLRTPFYTPSFSTSVIRREPALLSPLFEDLQAREDIAFYWLLSERGDILLHKHVHTLTRQLDVSLLSLPETSSRNEQDELHKRRAYWTYKMFEKILHNKSPHDCPTLFRQYGESLLGMGYYCHLTNNKSAALRFLVKSLKYSVSLNQLKLAIRIALGMR